MIVKKNENGHLIIEGKKGTYLLESVAENIVRCVYTAEDTFADPSEIICGQAEMKGIITVDTQKDAWQIHAGRIALSIDAKTEQFIWRDSVTGEVLLREAGKQLVSQDVVRYTTGGEAPVIDRVKTVDGERNFIRNLKPVTDRRAYRAKLFFDWQEDEGIYGLGQGEDGVWNYRHQNQYLYQHNMRIPMPVLVSDRGYALLFDCCSLMTFQDDALGSWIFLDTVKQLDYYVIAGENLDEIIAGIRTLTGRASMLPKWAYGYVQSKERYHTARELVEVAQHYRDLHIPLDCVVQDWYTWEEDRWGEKKVDQTRYSDLRTCMDELHALHAHSMVSVWPNMNNGTVDHTEFLERGMLLNDLCTYDAFNEEARELYWKQAKRELFDGGFDSWWCDSTEPFSGPDWNGEEKREPWERYVLVGGEHKHFLDPEVANVYALMHAKGMYENQRKETEQMRMLNLTRSGYISGQKYGAVLWSGDIAAKWSVLKAQIAEGMNMAISGYPYWTLDAGAFFTVHEKWQNRGCNCEKDPGMKWFWQGDFEEGIKDKGYQELYVRWMQFAAFLPMFRSHGTDTPREIWNFGKEGDPVYDALAKTIRLRYALMPYVYSLAGNVMRNHGTMMRSLLFDFAEDKQAAAIGDAYMFGPAFLVCPVTEPMYYGPESTPITGEKTRTCYLPTKEGTKTGWYDYYTGASYEGGQVVTVDASLDRMPLFVKSGSIIPMTEGIEWADQKTSAPMKLVVYPGADGTFTLYEDAGNGYGYEQGEYSTISISWCDNEKCLTIADRSGSYPGMEETRKFEICLAGSSETIIVEYEGKELRVEFLQ